VDHAHRPGLSRQTRTPRVSNQVALGERNRRSRGDRRALENEFDVEPRSAAVR
jgi:hypothetical protein